MKDLPKEIEQVLTQYQERYGVPPSILESRISVPLPEGLKIVTHIHNLPKNIILLGIDALSSESE